MKELNKGKNMTEEEMENEFDEKIIVKGIDHNGNRFRPSDWVERLASVLSTFEEDNRLKYHHSVFPCNVEGYKSLIVSKKMSQSAPDIYSYILDFAHKNNLSILDDRRKIRCVVSDDDERRENPENLTWDRAQGAKS